MALVNIVNMVVLDNPTHFSNPFQFEITFECLQPLEDDLEFKIVYVGSAESSSHDQTLDEVLVGPVPVGTNKFVLQADSPDTTRIPPSDILGVTVVLVTCSYREQEFARVGYYVNNEYVFEEGDDVEAGPAMPLDLGRVRRVVLADKPRVTRFPIDWSESRENQEVGLTMTTNVEEQSNELENIVEESDMEMEKDDLLGGACESEKYMNNNGAIVSPLVEVDDDGMMVS
mmetsp:Transcript_20106/g.24859  ORF Transcript_20106/g.24859 Transcript_20106/m.24859 type:complete len:229 (-) Transcript_20106:131-817(-)|eukprot:CAMPEP_0172498380 /NCGR_PEP_ID=MMETSP1066-20121228/113146_1 /TAXON_ID=671091 /ORGANISM="Coscinodiscus wailesii, Strain CCMP2513" /LENGTH=228 /DNA_ID=CAMNT_0013271641 /DNA_START=126 /DNA_END=812 /DNA_ORIENTATION=+